MRVNRKRVCEPYKIGEYTVDIRAMAPDLLVYVDGDELPNFYRDKSSGDKAARAYIEQKEKAKREAK